MYGLIDGGSGPEGLDAVDAALEMAKRLPLDEFEVIGAQEMARLSQLSCIQEGASHTLAADSSSSSSPTDLERRHAALAPLRPRVVEADPLLMRSCVAFSLSLSLSLSLCLMDHRRSKSYCTVSQDEWHGGSKLSISILSALLPSCICSSKKTIFIQDQGARISSWSDLHDQASIVYSYRA